MGSGGRLRRPDHEGPRSVDVELHNVFDRALFLSPPLLVDGTPHIVARLVRSGRRSRRPQPPLHVQQEEQLYHSPGPGKTRRPSWPFDTPGANVMKLYFFVTNEGTD